jgi:GT2 family glycosyltransferase
VPLGHRRRFFFGDNFHVDELGRILAFGRGYVPSLRDWMAFAGWTPLQDACFWRRDLYERVGGIDPDLDLAIDYDLFLRFSLEGRCVYVPVAFSAFRRHPEQRSIAMAARYAAEREWSRRRALAAARRSKVDQRIREAAFWVMSRYRDHVLRRAWDLRSLHGIPVMSLASQPHYGTMTRTPRPAIAPEVRRGPDERLCR